MDKARQHRNGARGNAQPRTIPSAFAGLAANKMRWNTTAFGSPASSRLTQECTAAEAAIVATRSTGPAEVQMKLAMLLDWLDDTLAPSARLLLQSAIDDLDPKVPDLLDQAKPEPATPSKNGRAMAGRKPAVAINRRARPCVVDGVLFPSVIAAAKAYGIPYGQMRQQTAR